MMKRGANANRYFTAALMIIVLATGAAGRTEKGSITVTPAPEAEVPAEYYQTYSSLQSDLDRYDAYLNAHHGSYNSTPVFAAELLPANSNRGEDLLKPDAIKGVSAYLDRLQAMGVQGVTIAVHYPTYTPRDPDFQAYRVFYRQVAGEVQKRHMKMDVETGVIFANTAFSKSTFSFHDVPYETYKVEDKQMVRDVIADMHPDYLNLGAEPDTLYKLTGYKELNDPQQYKDLINYLLDGLNRNGTKVCAGIGSWGNIECVRLLASQTSLNCISIHVYPAFGQCLENALAIAGVAHQNNKSVVMDEAWLYKTDIPPTSGMASSEEIFRRDVFSFWAPLDQQFISLMVRTCREYGIEYISPFWANYFFAYLDYTRDNHDGSYTELASAANQAAAKNILVGEYTATADHYMQLIAGG